MEYDIVIIGAGTAGCVLAYNLSKQYSVLVVESGVDNSNDPLIAISSNNFLVTAIGINKYFWDLGDIVPNVSSIYYNPGVPGITKTQVLAGETYGGSSAVSSLMYVRGTEEYYNKVSEYVEDESWNAKHSLTLFKHIENFEGVDGQYNPRAHGYRGKVNVTQGVENLAVSCSFVRAVKKITGLPKIDYNDFGSPVGIYNYWQLTERDNIRETSYTAYLRHSDVKILSSALAVGIEGDTNIKGLRVIHEGEEKYIKINKKLIVCAGMQSPLFLMRNGIGDANLLQELNIPIRVNNPLVGKHLHNHPAIVLVGTGTLPTSATNKEAVFSGGAYLPKYDNERKYEWICLTAGPNTFIIYCMLLDAKSEGSTKILYKDPLRSGTVDMQYFTNEQDIEDMMYIYPLMYKTLKGMGLKVRDRNFNKAPVTKEDIKQYILTKHMHAYHWTGGCRMGPNANEGVVDSNGKVFGMKNLYVADASILPFNVLGNTMAATYLVGENISRKL